MNACMDRASMVLVIYIRSKNAAELREEQSREKKKHT